MDILPFETGCAWRLRAQIDGYSRFMAVVPVKKKGYAMMALMRVVDARETKTENKVGIIRTEDGTYYTWKEIYTWEAAKGIERQRSALYLRQHNVVADLYNCIVQERTTALLTDAGLDLILVPSPVPSLATRR